MKKENNELSLHLFVEGKHDIVFYKAFLDTYLRETLGFRDIDYYPYAEKRTEREKLLQIINRDPKANYLICADLDREFDEDLRQKKIEYLSNLFRIDRDTLEHKIFAVVIEIESWYLAGFTLSFYEKLKIDQFFYNNTEQASKTVFKNIARTLRIDDVQLRDTLTKTYRSNFSIEEAKQRNESFRKFFEKVSSQVKRLN